VTGSFDGLRQFALVLQRGACQPAWKDLSLVVYERKKEISILVIDMLDARLFEEAKTPFRTRIDLYGLEISDLTLGLARGRL